ncbi:bifunctional diguanylate cyclase/phosphodiesterase [Acidovorax sp. BL-A-41-H1]|uniref:bifunctional diguanylate cyclase/phosphodiesterase n=1 Tax=Acidovorax sp. BL-A-41-H1 TaxID=3421102 RepID=UPI003F79E320
MPPMLAAVLLGITFLYWQTAARSAHDKRERNFEVAADHIASNIKDRMAVYEMVLRGVKGYFEGSDQIDREEFQTYVSALRLPETRPGLRGVALVPLVSPHTLAAHVADMHQRGMRNYAVWPSNEGNVTAPVMHIEPLNVSNRKVLGFDALTVPALRAAMESARASGELRISEPVVLPADPSDAPTGVVMYLPLYSPEAETSTGAGRTAGLVGWVSAAFQMRQVVQGLAAEFDADIDIHIADAAPETARRDLYGTAGEPAARDAAAGGELITERWIEVGGRRWLVRMTPTPAFDLRFRDDGHHAIAAIGVVLSGLLAWFAWVLATQRERAAALARTATASLQIARDELESTLNAVPDLLLELDGKGRIHQYRFSRSTGQTLAAQTWVGRLLQDVVSPDAAAGCIAALEAAERNGYSAGHQYTLDAGDGSTRWFELSIARKENTALQPRARFVALARDITERKFAEAKARQLANFDVLTNLPNRRMFMDRLDHALALARQSGQVGALLYVDLDNFKQINDALGHSLGDALLVSVAARLSGLLRPGDLVARMGGDEFVVLGQNLGADTETAGRLALIEAERIRTALEAPYAIGSREYTSAGSIGITLFPKHGEAAEDLLREADTAMYGAKGQGRNRVRFFEVAMQADVHQRMSLEQDLGRALAEGQLSVAVQSQVNAAGKLVGGELLMRWMHPDRGNITPAVFIPIAESSGHIVRMGTWMIEQACEVLARMQRLGLSLSLSVNVSQLQFRQDDFVIRIREVLERTGASAQLLVLEVTESLLIENLDDTIARMTELVAMGIRFSIDDFGTGYSSLAYLKRLPLYELKIDKSFVQDTPQDPSDTAIVQSIISVASHLKLHVVAEGVETAAQADFLVASHCPGMQGYFFGRPVPMQEWLAMLPDAQG